MLTPLVYNSTVPAVSWALSLKPTNLVHKLFAQVDASTSFLQLLSNLDKSKYQAWPEAELGSCLRYGRGKRGLLIPSEWKEVDDMFRSMIFVRWNGVSH